MPSVSRYWPEKIAPWRKGSFRLSVRSVEAIPVSRKATLLRRAFTVVEVLLAMMIVAVFLTLALVAARSIRQRGDDAHCVANLRQSGMAILSYLHDRNGRFLPKKYWFEYSSYRVGSTNRGMREYFGVEPDSAISKADSRYWIDTMLTCPAMLRRYPQLKQSIYRRGYTMNRYLFLTVGDNAVSGYRNFYAIPNPASMWAIADGAVGGVDNPAVTEPLSSIDEGVVEHAEKYLPFPHTQKRQQFFFLGGHVEGLTREELQTRSNKQEFWGNQN